MDHWGDPWADDADADATPPKQEKVAFSQPATSAAPVLLNSFLDDAQWGSGEDEGFGDWAISAGNESVQFTPSDGHAPDLSPTLSATNLPDGTQHGEAEEQRRFDLEDQGWGHLAHSEEPPKEVENVVSETSDSATTIQPDDDPARVSKEFPGSLHHDDELSTRPSTSPSDISHTEAPPTESPRTSFEDERVAAVAATPIHEEEPKGEGETEGSTSQLNSVPEVQVDDELGDFEDTEMVDGSDSEEEDPVQKSPQSSKRDPQLIEPEAAHDTESRHSSLEGPTGIGAYKVNHSLMEQLFPAPKPSQALLDTPEDPISTTSTRKAWYRLTRKQTMREYNTGMDDDNYVRVTWANSHIREDVGKIVGRWTTEDRMSGRGHSARASFYWDSSPANAPPIHHRQNSTVPTSSQKQLSKHTVQSLSTNTPAAFNWSSSPPAASDPWKGDNSDTISISSPVSPQTSNMPGMQAQENRSVSGDVTPGTPIEATHQRTLTNDRPIVPMPMPMPVVPKPESSMESDPWESLSQLDTTSHTKLTDTISESDGDDDEWGEMVESPAVSTTPTANFTSNSSRNPTLSTPASTPKSVKSSPFQPHISPFQGPASRHASPIVRLKTTVSPTSSTFRFNSFIPTSAVVEPIGQGILKRSTKTTDATPTKTVVEASPVSQPEKVVDSETSKPTDEAEVSEEFTNFESVIAPLKSSKTEEFSTFESFTLAPTRERTPTPVQEPAKPKSPLVIPITDSTNIPVSAPLSQTPTDPWIDATSIVEPATASQQAPQAPSEDPWSNADFSFFESAAPAPPSPPSHNPLSPSDPWSIFNTPAPVAHTAAPSQKPSIAGPPITNFNQRQQAAEDEIIAGIVRGLPNLRYMLK